MKSNKTLKYTGIIQGVLIATLLLLAVWIQVTFLYNTYYCEDYTFDFLRNMGIGYWDLRNNSSAFFLINSIAEAIAYFLGLMRLYVLKIIFSDYCRCSVNLACYFRLSVNIPQKHSCKRIDYCRISINFVIRMSKSFLYPI